MILAVDATRAVGLRTGVGRWLEYLIQGWSRQPLPFEQVRILAPAPITDLPDNKQLVQQLVPGSGSSVWWQFAHLRPAAEEADALFAIYTLPPGFRGRSVVYNLGIYEGQYAFPGWRARLRSWHQAFSARQADRLYAVSETTKSDLATHYRIPGEEIELAWPGLDPRFRPPLDEERTAASEPIAEAIGGHHPYFLFVGKLSQRRNVRALIEAFGSVASSSPDLRLILAGPNTWGLPLESIIAGMGLEGRVRQLMVDRETLILLYRFARAFVMPTENDGFSLTIMEAMASGLPVVTLRGAPLGVLDRLEGPRDHAEGGPVLEAADARPASLAAAMARLAVDDELCAELGRRGRRYAAAFPSWDETAAVIMEALAEVAGAHSGERLRSPPHGTPA
jgi:glycosyltransferase involved in cell wall biosynthesis